MLFSMGNFAEPIDEAFKDESAITDLIIADEVSQLSDRKIQEFCQPGGVGAQLVQEGKLKNKTLVRLSKKDDLSRRRKMMAMQLAKENNDPLFDKLTLNRVKERELLGKIMQKYGSRGERLAKTAQNEYLHAKPILPKSFMKAGGEDR